MSGKSNFRRCIPLPNPRIAYRTSTKVFPATILARRYGTSTGIRTESPRGGRGSGPPEQDPIASIRRDRALYPYQLYGAIWMLYQESASNQNDGFVADDVGLGKVCASLSALAPAADEANAHPTLLDPRDIPRHPYCAMDRDRVGTSSNRPKPDCSDQALRPRQRPAYPLPLSPHHPEPRPHDNPLRRALYLS